MVERSCNCFIHRCSSSAIVSMAQGFGHFWVLFTAFASACKWFYTISWASDQCNLQRMRWSATHHLLRVERNVTRISGRTFLLKEREERKEERGKRSRGPRGVREQCFHGEMWWDSLCRGSTRIQWLNVYVCKWRRALHSRPLSDLQKRGPVFNWCDHYFAFVRSVQCAATSEQVAEWALQISYWKFAFEICFWKFTHEPPDTHLSGVKW